MKLIWALLLTFAASLAHAVEPGEMLEDPVLEERAQAIDKQLRCVVCQSQSISESNAPLAKDLRLLVRERLLQGDSDDQAIAYIVERYGEYVLLKPRVQPNTYFLWAFPPLVLAAGGAAAFFFLRRARRLQSAEPLSDDEERELAKVFDERKP